MKLSTRTEGQLQIISVMEDRIDAAVARAFKEAMRDMIEDGPPVVILDLGQVTFIDSSGLGAVVATLKLLLPDRSLTLAGLTPSVDRVFRLTRMNSVFPLDRRQLFFPSFSFLGEARGPCRALEHPPQRRPRPLCAWWRDFGPSLKR